MPTGVGIALGPIDSPALGASLGMELLASVGTSLF